MEPIIFKLIGFIFLVCSTLLFFMLDITEKVKSPAAYYYGGLTSGIIFMILNIWEAP